ncbi:MAG TPA: enoyl-CoA hydratase/isomerase family protein [Actinomycetota bacterium]|nr:enoyl-CoA hydratase/isomerase family protein [Actinomycetota bacterium]
MLELERRGDVDLLWLDRPPVNAADLGLLTALADKVEEVAAASTRSLVLTGRGRSFSAGADLWAILEGDDAYAEAFVGGLVRAFGTLFTFPRPLVGAVNGHALAGGAIVACCCDHAVAADGPARIGVTEHAVGVPFPLAALEIVRHAVAPERFEEVVFTARTYSPAEAVAVGFVAEIVAPDALLDRALEVAERLGRVPATTYALIKEAARRPALDRIAAHEREHDAAAVRGWQSDEVKASIRSFLERTVRKSG